jgi:hypothetical protein
MLFSFELINISAFFRKDIFILLYSLFIIYLSINRLKGKLNISLYLLSFIFIISYCIVFLITDITIFFLPISSIFLGIAFKRENKFYTWLALMFLLGGLSCAVVFFIPPASLTEIHAILDTFPSGIQFDVNPVVDLSYKAIYNIKITLKLYATGMTLMKTIIVLILSLIPILYIAYQYKFIHIISNLCEGFMLKFIVIFSFIIPFTLCIFAYDFWRFIFLITTHYILFLTMSINVFMNHNKEYIGCIEGHRTSTYYAGIVSLCMSIYATSWYSELGYDTFRLTGPTRSIVNYLKLQTAEPKTFSTGDRVDFTSTSKHWRSTAARNNWGIPDISGTWMARSPSLIALNVKNSISSLHIIGDPVITKKQPELYLKMKINEISISTILLKEGDKDFTVNIPNSVQYDLRYGGILKIEFNFINEGIASEIGFLDYYSIPLTFFIRSIELIGEGSIIEPGHTGRAVPVM